MSMRLVRSGAAAFALAVVAHGAVPSTAMTATHKLSADSSTRVARERVDLFPAQDLASLAVQPEILSQPSEPSLVNEEHLLIDTPVLRGAPFSVTGIWREGGRRVVVIEGLGDLFLLCERCAARGAIHPGASLAAGYRFERMDRDQVVLSLPNGDREALPLTEVKFE